MLLTQNNAQSNGECKASEKMLGAKHDSTPKNRWLPIKLSKLLFKIKILEDPNTPNLFPKACKSVSFFGLHLASAEFLRVKNRSSPLIESFIWLPLYLSWIDSAPPPPSKNLILRQSKGC